MTKSAVAPVIEHLFRGVTDEYMSRFNSALSKMDLREIDRAISVIAAAWNRSGEIIVLGNGGSAVTALHFVTDWSKSIFLQTGRPFRARTLVDNLGLITAYSNDVSYADVFVTQLKNLARPGDLVVAISGSGNSENVIRAIQYANDAGIETLGLCGYSGGRLKRLAKHVVWVPVDDMQLCEDIHAMFGHIVMQVLCSSR